MSNEIDERPQRAFWRFQFSGQELADHCQTWVAWHTAREEYWKLEAETVSRTLAESTIKVTPMQVTGGQRWEASGDPQAMARLSEAQSKEQKHRAQRQKFDKWAKLFERMKGNSFTLDLDDINYFSVLEEVPQSDEAV